MTSTSIRIGLSNDVIASPAYPTCYPLLPTVHLHSCRLAPITCPVSMQIVDGSKVEGAQNATWWKNSISMGGATHRLADHRMKLQVASVWLLSGFCWAWPWLIILAVPSPIPTYSLYVASSRSLSGHIGCRIVYHCRYLFALIVYIVANC